MILFVKYKLRRRVKTFTFVHVRVKTDNWKAALSLVFVFKIISTFIGQNAKFFFMHVLKMDVLLL